MHRGAELDFAHKSDRQGPTRTVVDESALARIELHCWPFPNSTIRIPTIRHKIVTGGIVFEDGHDARGTSKKRWNRIVGRRIELVSDHRKVSRQRLVDIPNDVDR